MLYSSNEVLI